MITFRNHLKEQMKDPVFAEAYNREKGIIVELLSMLPEKQVKRAKKTANKEIGSIKRTKKKKLS